MKRSKIFLGLSAFVLAAAGAMATRAHNRTVFTTGYTKASASSANCPAAHSVSCVTTGPGSICTGGTNKTLYTTNCEIVLLTTNGTN